MAVPSQGTVAVGDKITASLWNDDVRDAVNFLISPPRCKLYRTTNTSITTNTWTAVSWNAETFDTDTMHDNMTNPQRTTFTTAGTYLITFRAMWAANGTGTRYLAIEKNGTTTQGSGTDVVTSFATAANGGTHNGINVTVMAEFAANDYIMAFVNQTSGGALNLSGTSDAHSSFAALWVSS
jgi:hypothetical protein